MGVRAVCMVAGLVGDGVLLLCAWLVFGSRSRGWSVWPCTKSRQALQAATRCGERVASGPETSRNGARTVTHAQLMQGSVATICTPCGVEGEGGSARYVACMGVGLHAGFMICVKFHRRTPSTNETRRKISNAPGKAMLFMSSDELASTGHTVTLTLPHFSTMAQR